MNRNGRKHLKYASSIHICYGAWKKAVMGVAAQVT